MNARALIRQFISIYKKRGFIFFFVFIIKALNDTFIKKYLKGSFSQKGEDLIIERVIGQKKKGFYIDIGAHNPNIFNNTKKFYLKGWSGINIEPNPILLKEFIRQRKRDINLNIGIKNTSGIASFYEFEVDGLSTFSKDERASNLKLGYKLKQELEIPVFTLKSVIEKYCTAKIDFLSIDTEGLDFEVLESNNWKKFRPTVVCVETGDFNLMITGKRSSKKVRIDSLMRNNRYKEYYDNGLNTIYLNNK
ncbi:MAG: FkbM family methyltransferase [Patescibacteria group bacterium]